jgi:hypothetical protein
MKMTTYNESFINVPTLPFSGRKAFVNEIALVGTAIALPVAAHLLRAPVRYLLPMHWTIILAGLIYGWRAGALAGLVVPSFSFLLSGMPLPNVLPSMTVELVIYGSTTGVLREKFKLNPFLSVTVALLLGRAAFIGCVVLTNQQISNLTSYLHASLLPGLGAAVCQIALLPLVAHWWINTERHESNS